MGSEAVDYPVLYDEFTVCADHNQKRHFQVIQVRIGLLIAIAVLGAIAWAEIPEVGLIPSFAISTFLAIMSVVTIIMENKTFEKSWHTTRAVAETIKRESWLYMMRAKPYEGNLAKNGFIKFLIKIIESKTLPWAELVHNEEGAQVTEIMEKIRSGTFEERKKYYIQNRISDQRVWYAKKAKKNSVREGRLTILMWLFLALGVGFSFINAFIGAASISLPVNAVGIATTISASFATWVGARSYRELSISYSLVAHELLIIEENTKTASTEEELSKAVEDAEAVMALEHNLWKVKRQIT